MKTRRWESRSGKHWVELYSAIDGFSYKAPGCGGHLGPNLVTFFQMLQTGYFQPDANKLPMKEVTLRQGVDSLP